MANCLSGWAKRLKITVDKDVIDAALSGFPVPVYISAASGIGDVDASCVFDELTSDANRKKIAVTTSDGQTQCYVEIERWDHANEKAWLHVKLPSVSESADTDLYLYYDSSQADNTTYVGDTGDAAAEAVWTENYLAVYHMADATTSTILDSTSNDYDGTKGAASNPSEADAQFSKGQNYDANTERIELGDVLDLEYNQTRTIEALIKTSSNNYNAIFTKIASTTYQGHYFSKLDSANGNVLLFQLINNWGSYRLQVNGVTSIADGNWHHAAVTYSGNNAASGVNLYLDGGAESKSTVYDTLGARSTVNAVTASIGNRYEYNLGSAWIGDLDEVRISSVVRSAAWLKATYNGLFDSLLTFGAEEQIITPKEAYHAHAAEKPAVVGEWLHPDPTVLLHHAETPVLLPLWMHPKDTAHSFYADLPIIKAEVIEPTASILFQYADKPYCREDLTLQDTYHDHFVDQPSLTQNAIPFSSYLSVISAYPHLTPEIFPSGSILLQPVDRPKLSSTAWARVSPPDATWSISQPTATTWTKQ